MELRDPFYSDQYEQEHIKPPVTHLLLSSELYCRACGLLLGGHSGAPAPPRDNSALLQLLSKRGVAPKDQDVPVTEADLRHKPIKMVRLPREEACLELGGVSPYLPCVRERERFVCFKLPAAV